MKAIVTNLYYVISIFIILNSCSRKSLQQEDLRPINSMPVIPLTTVNLPVSIRLSELNNLINEQIKNTLSDGLHYEDGYKVVAQLDGDLKVSAQDQNIDLIIPIYLEIFPKTSWSQIKAFGRMDLPLKIEFNIFQDKFISKSKVGEVSWRTPPKLSVMGLKVSVESIANRFVEKYKSSLTNEIDSYLQNVVDLTQLKVKIKKSFDKPFYSTEDNIIHFFVSPSEIGLGPVKVEGEKIIFPLAIYLENVIGSEKPKDLYNDLSFSIRPIVENNIQAVVQGRIPMNYLEILVKEGTEKQTFGNGIAKITIQQISLTGNEKTVTTLVNTTGAFNGRLQINFNPEFNQQKKEIELKNFYLKVLDGKKIEKAMLSLVKGIAESKIKKEIELMMNQLLSDYRTSLLSYLEHKEVYPGMILNGELKNWTIDNFEIVNQIMFFQVKTDLIAGLDVLRIDKSLYQMKTN